MHALNVLFFSNHDFHDVRVQSAIFHIPGITLLLMPRPNNTTVYVLMKGIFLSTRGKNVCRKSNINYD
jgi:hypothetical protein